MIYERIKKLCSARGISIYELEKTLGFTRGHLYKWKESSPTTEKIKLVADYFGVTIDFLVADEKAPEYPN